jgi:hypothetical protein
VWWGNRHEVSVLKERPALAECLSQEGMEVRRKALTTQAAWGCMPKNCTRGGWIATEIGKERKSNNGE